MRGNATKAWSPEEEDRLRTLLESGTSPSLVAAKLKRSVAAIKTRAILLGVSRREIKRARKAKGK